MLLQRIVVDHGLRGLVPRSRCRCCSVRPRSVSPNPPGIGPEFAWIHRYWAPGVKYRPAPKMRSVKPRRFSNPPGFVRNRSVRPVFRNTTLDPWNPSRARRATRACYLALATAAIQAEGTAAATRRWAAGGGELLDDADATLPRHGRRHGARPNP
jgi:hypothetical protein